MLTKKLLLTRLTLSLSLFTLALSGCQSVIIKNRTPCAVNGSISLGGTCAGTITGVTSQKTMDEMLDMIESRPGHPPAIIQTADEYGEETTELQVACRILGDSCTYELQKTIENRKKLLERVRGNQ